jgi:hypothetical protein
MIQRNVPTDPISESNKKEGCQKIKYKHGSSKEKAVIESSKTA